MKVNEIKDGVRPQDDGSSGLVYCDGPRYFGFLYKTAIVTSLLSILLMLFLASSLFGEYRNAPFFYLGMILVAVSGIVLFGTFPIGMIWFPVWRLAIRTLAAAGVGQKTAIVLFSVPTTIVGIHLLFSVSIVLFFGGAIDTFFAIDRLEVLAILVGSIVAPMTAWKSY